MTARHEGPLSAIRELEREVADELRAVREAIEERDAEVEAEARPLVSAGEREARVRARDLRHAHLERAREETERVLAQGRRRAERVVELGEATLDDVAIELTTLVLTGRRP